MVTWVHGDEKKVAIVSFKVEATRAIDGFSIATNNEYHVYAIGSSAESEHLAVKDMLRNVQLQMAAVMPSIAESQSAIVLGDNITESVSPRSQA